MSSSAARRSATLAAPVAVPLTMTAVFALLRRRLPRRAAYAAGFAVYWAGWCAAFPLWVLRPHGVRRALRSGRRSGPVDVALLSFPVAGAVGAGGEELLWRGTFLDQLRGDVLREALWPLAGFTRLAPGAATDPAVLTRAGGVPARCSRRGGILHGGRLAHRRPTPRPAPPRAHRCLRRRCGPFPAQPPTHAAGARRGLRRPGRLVLPHGRVPPARVRLVDGGVRYDPEPLDQPAEGGVLLCCSQPAGPVALDL